MLKTYKGACHCGSVRFEVDLDLSRGTGKCNCSYCARNRLWIANVRPQDFRLLSGEGDLADYRGKNPVAHHQFCRTCGVHPFEWVDTPNLSGQKYYSINVLCLDGVDLSEILAAPVAYYDGLNDKWEQTPAEIRHL
ncbi:MAG TPA: GFA family protein [Rhizomicrobium sp.]|nr:GFA family protein [Rhizomicrobium sp.]